MAMTVNVKMYGHSYKLSVTVIGKPITDRTNVKYGYGYRFYRFEKIVKEEIVDEFDHTLFSMKLHLVELAHELKTEVTTLFSRLSTYK
jgi:6-pyruvoyltetrahydropterin/6-carboxytetrahydropterin synthase